MSEPNVLRDPYKGSESGAASEPGRPERARAPASVSLTLNEVKRTSELGSTRELYKESESSYPSESPQ